MAAALNMMRIIKKKNEVFVHAQSLFLLNIFFMAPPKEVGSPQLQGGCCHVLRATALFCGLRHRKGSSLTPLCAHTGLGPAEGLQGNERLHPVSRPVLGSQEGGGQDQVPTLYPSPPWTLESVQILSSGVKQEAKRGCI